MTESSEPSEVPEPRPRLSASARIALVATAVVVVGAIGFLVWLLTTPQDPNQEATRRLQQWEQLFEQYRDVNHGLPELPDGGYCLGTGFPTGSGGTANCRDYDASTYYTEAGSASLMDALAAVGPLPRGVSAPVRGTIGPYAEYRDGKIVLLTAEEGGCVAPATEVWNDGAALFICGITLTR